MKPPTVFPYHSGNTSLGPPLTASWTCGANGADSVDIVVYPMNANELPAATQQRYLDTIDAAMKAHPFVPIP